MEQEDEHQHDDVGNASHETPHAAAAAADAAAEDIGDDNPMIGPAIGPAIGPMRRPTPAGPGRAEDVVQDKPSTTDAQGNDITGNQRQEQVEEEGVTGPGKPQSAAHSNDRSETQPRATKKQKVMLSFGDED